MQHMFLYKYKKLEENMILAADIIKSSNTTELLSITLDRNINLNST